VQNRPLKVIAESSAKPDDLTAIPRKSNGRRGIRTCDFHRVRMARKAKNPGK